MRTLRHLTLVVILATGISLKLIAGPLDPREIALVMESTVVDIDTSVIALSYGNDFLTKLNYVSQINSDGWTGRMWGTYQGHTVDVYYIGSVSFVGGANSQYDIAYNSTWLFDEQSATGAGTGVFTDPEFGFKIDLLNLSVSGSVSINYGIATLTLSGTKDFSNHTLTVAGEASALDIPLIGSAASAELAFTFDQLTGEYKSTATGKVLGGWLWEKTETVNKGTIRRPRTPPPPPPPPPPNPPPQYPYVPEPYDPGFGDDPTTSGYNNMEVYTVPEPSTVVLVSFGMITYALSRRYCKRIAH